MKQQDVINNVQIYGLEESMIRAGYPMRTTTLSGTEFATYKLQDKDISRATKLGKVPIGTGHDNFLNGIIVQFDLTLPIKVWTELQRYHFIDFVSSQSTMHCITKFDLSDLKNYSEYTDKEIVKQLRLLQAHYKLDPSMKNLKTLLYSLPVGFKLTAGMTTNYRQLKTIYQQRKNHLLDEWRVICNWIESLPYMEDYIDKEDDVGK